LSQFDRLRGSPTFMGSNNLGSKTILGSKMSLYFFRISHGRYSGASDQGSEFESCEAAWAEMTKVCANLLGGISRSLKQNSEWQMEMLDEARKPVFRIRLVAEKPEQVSPIGPAAARRYAQPF
jgi:hypothetical protein